jgi:hypothetical protein
MKKLLVKHESIDIPFSSAVPEKWVKDGIEVFEQPEYLDGWEYVAAIPEVTEVKSFKTIAQTQGTDEELSVWLAGDSFKYPEGYVVEYIDISAQVEQERINSEALAYLADTDWMQIRFTETNVEMPLEVKQLRAEARSRIVR